MTASYVALVRLKPARRLLYALAAATFSFGMLSLTILLTVERSTGSYRTGGFAVAAFALAAGTSAPFRGRLIDRGGARVWLPGFAFGYATSLLALDLVAHGGGPPWSLVPLAGTSGLSAPPLFAWTGTLALRRRPRVHPARLRADVADLRRRPDRRPGRRVAHVPLLTWAGAVVCSALGSRARCFRCRHARAHARRSNRARCPPCVRAGHSSACSRSRSSSVPRKESCRWRCRLPPATGAYPHWPARCLRPSPPGACSVRSGTESRRWQLAVLFRFLRAVLLVGLLLVPAAFAQNAAELGVILFFAGLAFGPATVSIFEALDVIAPGSGAEALTWVTSAEAAGSAGGSAAAGVLGTNSGSQLRSALPRPP